jgi:hypothetical protein
MQLFLHCEESGDLKGEGVDYVGPWTLVGSYSPESNACSWTKTYVGKHRVFYDGLLGTDGIRGRWRIEPVLTGTFHIWPETMGHLTEMYLRAGIPVPVHPEDASRSEDLKRSLIHR